MKSNQERTNGKRAAWAHRSPFKFHKHEKKDFVPNLVPHKNSSPPIMETAILCEIDNLDSRKDLSNLIGTL